MEPHQQKINRTAEPVCLTGRRGERTETLTSRRKKTTPQPPKTTKTVVLALSNQHRLSAALTLMRVRSVAGRSPVVRNAGRPTSRFAAARALQTDPAFPLHYQPSSTRLLHSQWNRSAWWWRSAKLDWALPQSCTRFTAAPRLGRRLRSQLHPVLGSFTA